MKAAQSGAPHWSKDFVEHLRTVHFALITVSVGLVLLILSSRQYSPGAAIVQLGVLSEAANNWDVNRLLAAHTIPELTGSRGYPRVVKVQPTTDTKNAQLGFKIVRFWSLLTSD